MPKVSVLMPVYNGSKYLVESIESILKQSFTNFEFVIIDDGSEDKSSSIINSYKDQRVKYYRNDINLGIVKSLNKGIQLCKGEYIARMDCDDIATYNRLRLQVNFMDMNPDYGLCGTWIQEIDANSCSIKKIRYPVWNKELKVAFLFDNHICHPSVMIRRSILEEFAYDNEYLYCEDFKLWTKLIRETKCINLPFTGLLYRVHLKSISNEFKSKQQNLHNQILMEQLNGIIRKSDNEDNSVFLHDTLTYDQILKVSDLFPAFYKKWVKKYMLKKFFLKCIIIGRIYECLKLSFFVTAFDTVVDKLVVYYYRIEILITKGKFRVKRD